MPLSDPYGVLKGTIVGKLDSDEAHEVYPNGKPHFQLKVDADGDLFRVAINVMSDSGAPNLMVYKSDDYKHPILADLPGLEVGFTPLKSKSDSGALDFIRQNLFDLGEMVEMPTKDAPSGNDMNDLFELYVEQAMKTSGALVYAFGGKWHDGKPDPYFKFPNGQGVHEIHMNQGNPKPKPGEHGPDHSKDNGVYQDGALFIYYPDENRWAAVFCRFQSQVVHTDEKDATPIAALVPRADAAVVISAALVNPRGADQGREKVYILNTSSQKVDLEGWSIVDKADHAEVLHDVGVGPGDVLKYTLSGKTAQLGNNGGTITLLNKDGLKVSGVAYTAEDAAEEDRIVQF